MHCTSHFKEAGVMLDVFPEKLNNDVEIALMGKRMPMHAVMEC